MTKPTVDQYRVRREWHAWRRAEDPDNLPAVSLQPGGFYHLDLPTPEEVESWDAGGRDLDLQRSGVGYQP